MSAKTDTTKKRANGHRSRKGTNGKVINAKHNDRNFDVSKADHISENLIDKNVIWKYVDVNEGGEKEEEKKAAEEQKSESEFRETLDEYEEKVYEKYFSTALEKRNEKQIKARHKDRVQNMEQYRLNAKSCPEESIWTIGNRDNRIEPELLQTIWEEFTAWHKETYPNVLMLDATLHLDEPNAAPHIHRRDVWRYEVDGHWEISQKEALKAMGIERPDLSKKESKYNNAKMTYTAQTRAKWIEIAEAHGIEIEKEPQEKSRSGLTMLQLKKRTLEEQIEQLENDIAVLDSQYENKTEIDKKLDKEIAEKEKQLSKKAAELDGINARIEESKQEKSKAEQQAEELKKALTEQVESSKNVIQNLFDKAKGGRKLTAEEVEQFNAVVGCLDTLTELKETATLKDKGLDEKAEKLKKKIDETNTEIIGFKKAKSELSKEKSKLEKDKKKLDEEKELFKKNKQFIIAAEGQRRAEQILAGYGIQPEGYGIDEQIQQAQRTAEQEQKGAEK